MWGIESFRLASTERVAKSISGRKYDGLIDAALAPIVSLPCHQGEGGRDVLDGANGVPIVYLATFALSENRRRGQSAADSILRGRKPRSANPVPANPISSRAHALGSGAPEITAENTKFEPCRMSALPSVVLTWPP
jgi:hypothetical protein